MTLSLIIFDCDGVILESVDAKTHAYERVGEQYGKEAGQRLKEYHSKNGGVNRTLKFEWFCKEVLHKEPEPGEIDSLCSLFAKYSLDEVLHSQTVPGVIEVIKAWKGRVPMYVASGAPHNELNTVLKKHGLTGYFDGIYGAPPGKTDLLKKILAETGLAPCETVMVGDSGTDQYAAEAVQCHFYGRGEYFRHSGHPWHTDLTQLTTYLESMVPC